MGRFAALGNDPISLLSVPHWLFRGLIVPVLEQAEEFRLKWSQADAGSAATILAGGTRG